MKIRKKRACIKMRFEISFFKSKNNYVFYVLVLLIKIKM